MCGLRVLCGEDTSPNTVLAPGVRENPWLNLLQKMQEGMQKDVDRHQDNSSRTTVPEKANDKMQKVGEKPQD